MGTPSSSFSAVRLLGVGSVVFVANAALLVLQLVAGKLLAPFVGSSLETWTSVIGVFLTGIALGNGYGGKLADRYPTPRTLAVLLGLGAIAALWMYVFPLLLDATGWHQAVELGPRIPLLAFVLCFPAGLVLSLLTPLAIKLGLPDVGKAGRVAGLIFALSTLGCLLGNYLTGFYLIPSFTLNTIVLACVGVLALLAGATALCSRAALPPAESPIHDISLPAEEIGSLGQGTLNLHRAYLIVFLASFGGMTLELTAVRLLAQELGVSLYTWTGIIGVMLAGTAAGNFLGGQLADRYARHAGETGKKGMPLAITLLLAGGATVIYFVTRFLLTATHVLENWGLVANILGMTFALFFPPMFLLGMVSPQVIRLAVPDVKHAGAVAGRIYGWSTAGAIVGTFGTGYVLLSGLGPVWALITVVTVLVLASLLVAKVWENNLGLYLLSSVLGGVVGSFIVHGHGVVSADPSRPGATLAVKNSNYYTILVSRDMRQPWTVHLTLDHLLHSVVDPERPTYLYYEHEGIQMEMLRDVRTRASEPKVLVIGGGGFTFPRCAKTLLPEARVDVVEIDPAVTQVAINHLGFDPKLGVRTHHMDGRQFIAEKVRPGTYDLVMLDAVNDYSVPAHLTTREFNEAVKKGLSPNGVYLLTVIDGVNDGRLWKAAYRTLKQSFKHVELIASRGLDWDDVDQRHVFVLYASDRPLDAVKIWTETEARLTKAWEPIEVPMVALAGGWTAASQAYVYTRPIPATVVDAALADEPEVLLTDQFAPVDNLMADVFRKRNARAAAE